MFREWQKYLVTVWKWVYSATSWNTRDLKTFKIFKMNSNISPTCNRSIKATGEVSSNKNINSETLSSLAMLRVHAEHGLDYFDYLVPFITYVLQKERPDTVSDAETQTFLRNEFGLSIPQHACGFVLQRLAKRKVLERGHGVYRIVGQFKDYKLDERRAKARREQQVVLNNLTQHANEKHGLTWTAQEADIAILQYLSRFSIECMEAFTQGTSLPEIEGQADVNTFIVSSFVKHAHDYQPDLFEGVVSLVKGHMLANALLCSDLQSLQKKFENVTFYLDTPFLMHLLRFWGVAALEAATELVELLRKLNAKLAVFEHTVEEVNHVLLNAEHVLSDPSKASHPMIASLRREMFTVADMAMARGTLDRFFEKHGIVRMLAPGYSAKYQIDEAMLKAAVEKERIHYPERALDNDVNSIRSIFELRRNKHPYRLEDAIAVLVTNNPVLAKAAYNYGRQYESGREVSTVITDFSLANVAWLKAPLASPDLPRLELIAECYATMEPSPKLWGMYIEEIDRLRAQGNITAEDHDLLKLSLLARDQLMNLTLGTEAALSSGTVNQILERVKADLVKEIDVQLQEERKNHEDSRLYAEALQQKHTAIKKKIAFAASRVGTVIKWAIFVLLFVLISGGLFVTSGFLNKESAKLWWVVWIIRSLATIVLLWGLADAIWGLSIKHLAERCGRLCEKKTVIFLLRCLAINGDEL